MNASHFIPGIPQQDQPQFEYFPLTARGAADWCDGLPKGNPQVLATTLCTALDALNRTPLPVALRHDLLQTLEPTLQQAMTLVSHRLAHQPLELPAGLRALAALSEQLADLASTAHALVATQALDDPASIGKRDVSRLVGEALQRATHFAAHKVQLACQLRLPLDSQAWHTLHQLYRLAEQRELATTPVPGSDGRDTTVQATYLQPLLLACCQPGQLLYADVNQLYQGLGFWARLCHLHVPGSGEGLLAVDLDASAPPTYAATLGELEARHRLLDTRPLVTHVAALLDSARQARRTDIVLGSTHLPLPILEHVIHWLGSERIRAAQRVSMRQALEAAPGFSASHYHLAGQRSPEQLAAPPGAAAISAPRNGDNPFLREPERVDPWSIALGGNPGRRTGAKLNTDGTIEMLPESPAAESIAEPAPEPATLFPASRTIAVDASPGGYCLEWKSAQETSLKSGELLCLRELEGRWQLGILRWVRREQDGVLRSGVELLGGDPRPWSARVLRDGASRAAIARVFLQSATPLSGGRATLITPRSGFTEGQLLGLERDGEQIRVLLKKQIAMSAGMRQFEVERL